jgi:hypothetical protein
MGGAQNTLLLRGWSYWTRLLGVFMIQNFKISMVFCISKQLESDPNSLSKQLESDPNSLSKQLESDPNSPPDNAP